MYIEMDIAVGVRTSSHQKERRRRTNSSLCSTLVVPNCDSLKLRYVRAGEKKNKLQSKQSPYLVTFFSFFFSYFFNHYNYW